MTDPPSGLRHLPASVTSRMSTHTHNDKPTARTETSADIRRLTYAGTHTTRATLRSSPRHTPPSAADRSPCTGVSSGMLNRPSPAIRITYSKHETAAIPPHITRAGNFLVMRDRNTLESATHPACRTALRANRHKTRENRYDYGSHTPLRPHQSVDIRNIHRGHRRPHPHARRLRLQHGQIVGRPQHADGRHLICGQHPERQSGGRQRELPAGGPLSGGSHRRRWHGQGLPALATS